MTRLADLHIHTHFSDSTSSPQEVVEQARENEITTLMAQADSAKAEKARIIPRVVPKRPTIVAIEATVDRITKFFSRSGVSILSISPLLNSSVGV